MPRTRQEPVDVSGSVGYTPAEVPDDVFANVVVRAEVVSEVQTEERVNVKKRTIKPYFSEIVAGEPSQVVKDSELINAATYGDAAYVQELLDKGADVGASNNSPLQLAAANGHADTVKILLQKGAKRNEPEALIEAAKSGYYDVVRQLVGVDTDPCTLTQALNLAKKHHLQTPGAFRAREKTPLDGHDRTIQVLLAATPR